MAKGSSERETLTLRGKEIELTTAWVPQVDLRFYPDNPRVYSIVGADRREPPQEDIQAALCQMEHVRQLVQSIRANGGLIDPLLIRDGDFVVLEGNSRLAAYRLLAERSPVKWGKVKCKLLPKSVGGDDIFALLGEYHIIGKKDWAPYEQAGYLYRRHVRHGVDPSKMASEVGLSSKAVNYLIEVYGFMVKHKDNNPQRWSYYYEYLRHRAIRKAREKHPRLDRLVIQKINSGEIPRAVDVRDRLRVIARSDKACRAFATGKTDFGGAYEAAVSRGASDTCYQRLHRFRSWVAGDEIVEKLEDMPREVRQKCTFELKRIGKRCNTILKRTEG